MIQHYITHEKRDKGGKWSAHFQGLKDENLLQLQTLEVM